MNNTPPIPWIHIGECPFCVNGLVRVRSCKSDGNDRHLYALCDECEAMWLTPSTSDEKHFPDAETPQCPICSASLFGDSARWAIPADLKGSDWESQSIFTLPEEDPSTDPPHDVCSTDNVTDQFVEKEDEPNRGC